MSTLDKGEHDEDAPETIDSGSLEEAAPDGEAIELAVEAGQLDTVLFGMGCFWGPDSRLGSLDGVVQTRVGYAGGTYQDPAYRDMPGHAEVTRVRYDPSVLPFDTLFEVFRQWFTPAKAFGSKYRPLAIAGGAAQQALVDRFVLAIEDRDARPQVAEAGDKEARFWPAEDYHQKYRLKKARPELVAALLARFGPRWDESTLATKLNGLDKEVLADSPMDSSVFVDLGLS